jgi:hypothetical protein
MNDDEVEIQSKEVYAHFGLAIYLAQCLEHGLVNAFFFIDLMPNRLNLATNQVEWETVVETFMEAKFRLTLGRMIDTLAKITPVDPSLADLLSDALQKRNWLAHHYFRERAEAFLTSTGRLGMIAELESAQTLFRNADSALENAVEPARLKAGLTDELLAETYVRLRAQVHE